MGVTLNVNTHTRIPNSQTFPTGYWNVPVCNVRSYSSGGDCFLLGFFTLILTAEGRRRRESFHGLLGRIAPLLVVSASEEESKRETHIAITYVVIFTGIIDIRHTGGGNWQGTLVKWKKRAIYTHRNHILCAGLHCLLAQHSCGKQKTNRLLIYLIAYTSAWNASRQRPNGKSSVWDSGHAENVS